MNVNDKSKLAGDGLAVATVAHPKPHEHTERSLDRANPSGSKAAVDAIEAAAHKKEVPNAATSPAPRAPAVVASKHDSYVAMDQEKSALIAQLARGGTLSDAAKSATRIAELHGKPRHADEVCAMADCLEGSSASGVTPWLHASRDISAMDAPRKWRQDEAHPDGRLSVHEIRAEMEKNNRRPGRDPKVTSELLARYEAFRGAL